MGASSNAQTTPKNDFSWVVAISFSSEALKMMQTNPSVLTYPNYSNAFIVKTDPSLFVVGVILYQAKDAGKVHVVYHIGRTMDLVEK